MASEPARAPADLIKFADICNLMERVKKKKEKQEQFKLLSNFFCDFRAKVAGNKNASMFPILRLLLPKEERDRSAYNLKESKLAALLVKVLSLNKDSRDAQTLLNFRSENRSQEGDFAGVAFYILKNRVSKGPGALNVGEVNDVLDRIAMAEVGNKGPILDEALSYALRNLNADQYKWFLRIILKDLKLGIGAHRILSAFHTDAPDMYDNCGSLAKVCEELQDGVTRPPEAGIQLMMAVSPMLSEKLDVTRVMRLGATHYQIETKFDGERFQMHMQDEVFEYFSRKGYAWSNNYGKTYDSGLLTPHLKDSFSASVNSFILDGEMMGWHKSYQCLGSKGMAFDVKKITENSRFRPCYCVFDVLYYNGQSLVGPPEKGGKPLTDRMKILDTMFTDNMGVIMHSKRQICTDRSEILEALNKAIENQDEGIVVKDLESYYIANRRNAGWHKVKPEYTENAMTELDLLIIGADEAENKRQGRAKSFLLAVADRITPDSRPHRWLCVGRVAIGLTYDEREKVCAHLEKKWVSAKRDQPPQCLVFNKEKPDFWIMPEHSLVLQVRASELIRTSGYGTDYTLRFPRVVKIRDDKPVDDVMTLDEFNQLVADRAPVTKLSTKRINEDQISDMDVKIRKTRATKVLQVAEQFRVKTTGDVEVKSKALLGKKLHILSEGEECSKADLIKIIESHGGKVVGNNGPDTFCCIAGRLNHRVKMLIASQELDIISASWIQSLPNSEAPCTLSPIDMYSIKKTTKLNLSRIYDTFGDSYTDEIDEEVLKKCFKKMESNKPEVYLTTREMTALDKELFEDHDPHSFLRPFNFHFINKNTLLPYEARMYGATVCEVNSPHVTHVVVSRCTHGESIEQINGSKAIVSEEWLEDCFRERRLVPEYY